MANDLVQRRYNDVLILQRADGYLNATAMCKANGKLWADYARLKNTSEFMAELSVSMGIPIDSLVQSRKGRPERGGGTWVHPDVAINLAQWCSPRFAVRVSQWVRELLTTGSVSIVPQEPRPWSARLSSVLEAHRLYLVRNFGPGWWTVFSAMEIPAMILEDELIRHCLPLSRGDRPDISLGARWSTFRKGRAWEGKVQRATLYLAEQDITVEPYAYSPAEYPYFSHWLHTAYLPEHLPRYLGDKYKQKDYGLAGYSTADHACKRTTGLPARLPGRARNLLTAAGGFVPANRLLGDNSSN